MQDWNAVAAPLNWRRETPDYANFNPYDCPNIPFRKNAVHFRAELVNSGAFGEVQGCYGTWLNKANVIMLRGVSFPSGFDWHLDAHTLPPSNRLDLRAAATHEFGHMNGQLVGGSGGGHWWESQNTDLCPDVGATNYAFRESLCPSVAYGQIAQRIPAVHETQLLQAAY